MLRRQIRGDRLAHRTRRHGVCWAHGLLASFRRTCASFPSCSLSTAVVACRHASTAALSDAPPPPPPSSGAAPSLESPPLTTSRPSHIARPPPLSLLSWAVDGSCHTHRGCRRRLSMAERLPLLCETIRNAGSDVVALQDSTPQLAAALTATPHEGTAPKLLTTAAEGRLRIHCAELARELQNRLSSSALPTSSSLPASVAPQATEAPVTTGCHEQRQQSTDASAPAAGSPRATAASSLSCRYRLVGRARNGRCGEVQLFIKEGSAWDAKLLPGMGGGLTVELSSRTCAAPSPQSSASAASASDTASSEPCDVTSPGTKRGSEAGSVCHRCVLTTLDLSYRGKSLGTNAEGLLADAAISAEGSPFTLQAQQPSSLPAAKRYGRPPGQLDAHRAMALDWVYHHVRPDVVVGNLFTGAREHVPGFEDTWVRAGSPALQERTTNTCARHRIDRTTNYFYFQPSRNVVSPGVSERLARVVRSKAASSRPQSTPPTQPSTADGALEKAAASETTESQAMEAIATTVVAVAADAPVGTPIPLTASRDGTTGSWRVRSSSVRAATLVEHAGDRHDGTAASAAGAHGTTEGADDDVCASDDITVGMPEVAGRFQRCLLRGWVRRGPPSRSGHLSAHPFLRQYRYCRVVVLRPTVEVDLSASEQAWHARYLNLQNTKRRPATSALSATAETASGDPEGEAEEPGSAVADAPPITRAEEALSFPPRQARVSSRVRCSVSDQYPLLTLLA
ncbi:hypothetical protein LSCM1_05709 [Leishmania martiniquensis]|uniref:Endonuclease/exonuclease/phosphatase domain-containing protein n=1 Tax=Leishmania martiniquensis TaxID=1580590 RepID=A0A836GVB8_9TRYP|nr:hypothetical protein LSCM1_05709 [Leishmania martiniquensis]